MRSIRSVMALAAVALLLSTHAIAVGTSRPPQLTPDIVTTDDCFAKFEAKQCDLAFCIDEVSGESDAIGAMKYGECLRAPASDVKAGEQASAK